MCEYCIEPTKPMSPEQEAEHQRVQAQLKKIIDDDLARRGMTMEELLDSDCPGRRRPLVSGWERFWGDFRLNFMLITGIVW